MEGEIKNPRPYGELERADATIVDITSRTELTAEQIATNSMEIYKRAYKKTLEHDQLPDGVVSLPEYRWSH